MEPSAPPTPRPSTPFTIGFDLDMTLVDSRPGIADTYRALAAETGTFIDADLAVSRLGPPVEQEIAHWFPADRVRAMSDRYRALYPAHGVEGTLPLPGAREALDAIRARGGRSMVVTAKHTPNARLHIEHLQLAADVLVGDLWAERKGVALREQGASVYVGDHVGDVRAATAAGALSVSVTTGPCDEHELRSAGTAVVLPDLLSFPTWLDNWLEGHGENAGA
ncbi:HAD hydrolase-like protein [Streptomyces sp. RFCAC02]|uniref:HAD family hydrolase n=1 Tax=Streptomyces sp. RFCAC02 TaxID=2499143 RepID=UPI001021EF02|nr:HAD hydrolase-like protein [Streptomyces sp. RFCAC02]